MVEGYKTTYTRNLIIPTDPLLKKSTKQIINILARKNKQTKPTKFLWNRGGSKGAKSVARGRKRGKMRPKIALKSKFVLNS